MLGSWKRPVSFQLQRRRAGGQGAHNCQLTAMTANGSTGVIVSNRVEGRPGEHDPVPGTEAMMRQRSKWFPIEEALDLRQ